MGEEKRREEARETLSSEKFLFADPIVQQRGWLGTFVDLNM